MKKKKKARYEAAKERSVGQIIEHKRNVDYMTKTFINPDLLKKYELSFDPNPQLLLDQNPAYYEPPTDRRNTILTIGHMSHWRLIADSIYLSNGTLESFYLNFFIFSTQHGNIDLTLPEVMQFTSVNSYKQAFMDIHQPKAAFEKIFPVELNWPTPPSTPGGEVQAASLKNSALSGSIIHTGEITFAIKNPGVNDLQQFIPNSGII